MRLIVLLLQLLQLLLAPRCKKVVGHRSARRQGLVVGMGSRCRCDGRSRSCSVKIAAGAAATAAGAGGHEGRAPNRIVWRFARHSVVQRQ